MLEVFVVADGHAWWSFDGFGGNEFCGVALKFVDAVDESGAMNGFGGVGEWSGGGPLLEEIIDVGAGDGAGLTGRDGVDGECQRRFERAKLDCAFNFGGHGVAPLRTFGNDFGDCL